MLPFHKRSRANSSIEIGIEDLEDVELPPVRSPSPQPYSFRPADLEDDELTVIRMDKRPSSAPSQRAAAPMPTFPPPPRRPRFFEDDAPTMGAPGSRPLLSMSSRKLPLDEPSRARFEPPRSSRAVDAATSGAVGALSDLSMTSSVSTDIRKLRRGPAWALSFTAVGVLAGLIVALGLRGDGLAAIAAFVDPTHDAHASVAHAIPQADLAPGAAVQSQQSGADKPLASACNADAVAAAVVAKVEAHGIATSAPENKTDKKTENKTESPKPVFVARTVDTVAYVAPKPTAVVHHVEQPAMPAAPPPPVHRGPKSDLASASEADALAKAQLDAALTR